MASASAVSFGRFSPSCACTPSAPSFSSPRPATPIPILRETDALDVLELGARRMDLIGLKFQISDEIANSYAHAFALQTSKDQGGSRGVSPRAEPSTP